MAIVANFLKDYEDVTVHWIGAFANFGKKDGWGIKAYLYSDKVSENYPEKLWYRWLPAEFLPSLVIGTQYKNGVYQGNKSIDKNYAGTFTIDSLKNIDFVSVKELPFDFLQHYGDYNLTKEVICKYVTNKRIYYIPQMELVRCLLGVNSTFVTFLLVPQGVARLANHTERDEGSGDYHFVLSPDIPNKIVRKNNAVQIASIMLDKEYKILWNSIHEQWTKYAKKPYRPYEYFTRTDLKNIKLSFKGKILKKSKDKNGNVLGEKVFVRQITKVTNLPIPFTSMTYEHHSIRLRNPNQNAATVAKDGEETITHESDNELTDSGIAQYSSSAPLFKDTDTEISTDFSRSIKDICKSIPIDISKPRYKVVDFEDESKKVKEKAKRKYAPCLPISKAEVDSIVVDSAKIGTEFEKDTAGLNLFLAAMTKFLKLTVTQFYFRSFQTSSGKTIGYVFTRYGEAIVLELARVNIQSVSTLIIYGLSLKDFEENHEQALVDMLKNNNIHWNEALLEEKYSDKFFLMPHTSENIKPDKKAAENWAWRVYFHCWRFEMSASSIFNQWRRQKDS